MPDSLKTGIFAPLDVALFSSTVPLAAGAACASPWLDVSGSGDAPYWNVQAASDQAGTLLVYESEIASAVADIVGGLIVPVGALAGVLGSTVAASGLANKRSIRFVYTNGPIAQLAFSVALTMAAGAPVVTANPSDLRRVMELILRELRTQSLLIASLKEPGANTINLPYGPAPSSL